MQNDFLCKFKPYARAYDIWKAFKTKFGASSVTIIHSLALLFNDYYKHVSHTMKQLMRVMLNMIHELKFVGNNLKQKV